MLYYHTSQTPQQMEILIVISFFVVKTYTTSVLFFGLSLCHVNPFVLILFSLFFPVPGVLCGMLLGRLYKPIYLNRAEVDGKWRSPWIRSLRFWNILFWYFNVSCPQIETTDPSIIAFSPHGFWPIGTLCLITSL